MSRTRSRAAVRQLLLRLHFYAGILIAPFLLVAAVSGMLYAASYQVEDVLYRDLRTVEATGGEPLTLTKQVQAVTDAYPEATVTGVRTGGADDATQVLLDDGTVRESGAVPVAFVDPYTGTVLGDSTTYGSSQAGPFREWAASLHRHLHLGEPGRVYSELAASWLWVVALGGVALWLSRRRRPGALMWPRKGGTGRSRSLSWHAPIGMWLVLVLVFLSVTGVTWSRFAGEHVTSLREALSWQTPTLSADAGEHAAHEGHGGHHHGPSAFDLALLDDVRDTVVDAGFEGPLEITLPTGESGEFLVAETQRSYPVQQDTAVVATADGDPVVAEQLRFEDWPFMAQATNVLIAAHMGILFGLANQLVLFAAMVAFTALIVLGYRMWWQRRAKGAAVGRPYPRGSLRDLPWPAVAAAVPVVALVGWFFPLLGLSLVAFLAVDVLIGWWRRRPEDSERSGEGVSRRTAIGAATVTAALGAGAGTVIAANRERPDDDHDPASGTEPFFGEHQSGIATPMQGHALFASFHLADDAGADGLRTLLADWSAVAAALSRGEAPPKAASDGEDQFDAEAVAAGLDPARLTVTFGFGPALFAKTGLDAARPSKLAELPEFDGDRLQDAWCGGDLLLQICGEDPQVVSNAFLELRKRAVGLGSPAWVQHGFSSAPDGGTPRNLLGFKDGSANPVLGSEDFDARVWAVESEPDWFGGGTYLVFRKIRMRMPSWSASSAEEQRMTIGRERDSGAPLSGGEEFDHPDFEAVDDDGLPAVPVDSHVAVTHDAQMFRRGYNYDYGFLTRREVGSDTDEPGTDDRDGPPYDAGLLFASYQADPGVFIETQEKMASSDRLTAFIVAEGSAIFAIPPGAAEGGFVGDGLFRS